MTENQWCVSTDPADMLWQLESVSGRERNPLLPSDRKLLLWVAACQRLEMSRAVTIGTPDETEALADAGQAAITAVINAPFIATSVATAFPRNRQAEATALLRCVVGNPFRPVQLTHCCTNCGCTDYEPEVEYAACARCAGPMTTRQYITPTVLSLAQAAYDVRPIWKCQRCWGTGDRYPGQSAHHYNRPKKSDHCPDCNGSGRVEDGTLDPERLAVLSDALEEAGCPGTVEEEGPELLAGRECPYCLHRAPGQQGFVKCKRWRPQPSRGRGYTEGELGRCDRCNSVWEPEYDTVAFVRRGPHPLLAHLRSPGPHVRGCWALDLILGLE